MNIFALYRKQDSVKKRKECERFEQEGKITGSDLTGIRSRADAMSYALMAEIGTFHTNRAASDKSETSESYCKNSENAQN